MGPGTALEGGESGVAGDVALNSTHRIDSGAHITTAQAAAISTNTAKTSSPGLGTTAGTALEGNTPTITNAQVSAISTNTTNISALGVPRPLGSNYGQITITSSHINGDKWCLYWTTINFIIYI